MYNNKNAYNSSWGGVIGIGIIIVAIIGVCMAVSSDSGSGSSMGSSSRLDYDPTDYYDSAYDYNEPDYDYDYYYDEPEPEDDYAYAEPDVETWDCVDTISYDKNPYNDNYCVSSYGREMYATDSYAESLDPYYAAGTAGHPYYNSF